MGDIYKLKAERLKGDPYIGICFQALETLERLCLIQDYCQTKALNLTSFWPNRARGVNRNKRNRNKLLIILILHFRIKKAQRDFIPGGFYLHEFLHLFEDGLDRLVDVFFLQLLCQSL